MSLTVGTIALVANLGALPVYYEWDNKTVATSDSLFNDPFLAVRLKISDTNTSYSLEEAVQHIDDFIHPEWADESPKQVVQEEAPGEIGKVWVTNESHIFDHTSPVFHLENASSIENPSSVRYQLSSKINFEEIIGNFDETQSFRKVISLHPVSETFLNAHETYYFRAKVKGKNGFTAWSDVYPFQVIKPKAPQNVQCKNLGDTSFELSWESEGDSETVYYVYGGQDSLFIPSLYQKGEDNLLAKTTDSSVIVDDSCCYFRVIAEKKGCFSVPSSLFFAEEKGFISSQQLVTGYAYNSKVSREVWNSLTPYFLPYDMPVRRELDKIFGSKKRVLESMESLKKAGFKNPHARKWTRLVVTSHDKLAGYVVKLYTDSQHPHRGQPEYVFWLSRIKGVALIADMIAQKNLQAIFKTPKKWIYRVPEKPSPSSKARYRKNFILIEEDMGILNDPENEARFKSPAVTEDLLRELFSILQDIGLWDCAKPANIPFCRDGRIAFIDTQTYHTWPVKLSRLTPFLSPSMQEVWQALTQGYEYTQVNSKLGF
jgi:hypothetical protein